MYTYLIFRLLSTKCAYLTHSPTYFCLILLIVTIYITNISTTPLLGMRTLKNYITVSRNFSTYWSLAPKVTQRLVLQLKTRTKASIHLEQS